MICRELEDSTKVLVVVYSVTTHTYYILSTNMLDCFIWIGCSGDAEYTVKHNESYTNDNFFYADEQSDIGKFTGTVMLTDHEMTNLRNYIRTQRGNTISLPAISGVAYPFGRKSSSYPYNVKIVDFQDLGMWSVNFWRCQVTFAEVL